MPRRNPEVVARTLASGEVVLLDVSSGSYHGLNPVGGVIWELIDGRRSESDVCEAFRAQIEDPPADSEEVVARFLQAMRERRLLSD